MKEELREVSPYLAGKLQPKCFPLGYCDEFEQCQELAGVVPRKEEVVREFGREQGE